MGSSLFEDIIKIAKKFVPVDVRKEYYRRMIIAFEEFDWGTQNECTGLDKTYDSALCELYPGIYDEEI